MAFADIDARSLSALLGEEVARVSLRAPSVLEQSSVAAADVLFADGRARGAAAP
jgi:hypothetical protein